MQLHGPDEGRDFATLLRMGWTPDTLSEALEIGEDLTASRDLEGALAAVESARAMAQAAGGENRELQLLEMLAFRVAVMRGDAPRAIAAVNNLRSELVGLPLQDVAGLQDELAKYDIFRPELRAALDGLLQTIPMAATDEAVEEDDLPYLVEPDLGEANYAAAELEPDTKPMGGEAGPSWSYGRFPVAEADTLGDIRSRLLAASEKAALDDARAACEMGWSFLLMDDFEAAAVLFEQSLGDPDVRISAAEGLVRCRLNLAEAPAALAFLDRLGTVCFSGVLPEALMYWYGRAAEAVGDVRKARTAYRTVSVGAFPDVPARLGALP